MSLANTRPLAAKRTAASLQHVRAFLSKVFKHAVGDGRIDVNPIRDATCRVNCQPTKKAAHYTIEEMKGILSVLQGRDRALMACSFVGLRPAEIVGLKVADLKPGAIHVERLMWRGHISDGGKSKHSRRIVPIGPFVEAILREYLKTSPTIGGYVFENNLGRPLNTAGLEKLNGPIRDSITRFGYTWKTRYAGRHGAITEVKRQTRGNSQTIASMFGHTPEVEADFYVHGVPEENVEAALGLDGALAGNERQLRD